jgi:VCBS repeat-containing protein
MAAKTTGKVATQTGAAKDDVLTVSASEWGDNGMRLALDVLANDPGSARVYSLYPSSHTLGKKVAVPVVDSVTLASGAVVRINADGTLDYDASGLTHRPGPGEEWVETFSYTIQMGKGALSTAEVKLVITGANRAPELSPVAPVNIFDDANEALPVAVAGQLSATDPDAGASLSFSLVPGTVTSNDYGTLSFSSNGSFTFDVNPAALDALAQGESATVSFWAVATDQHGASSQPQEIRFTLVGADEFRPAVDDVFPSAVTGLDEDQLRATLDVLANDPEGATLYSLAQNGQGVLSSVTLGSGAVVSMASDGTLVLDYDASWQFFNLQSMVEGQYWSDSFTYTARLADGTLSTARVTLEIAGRNDVPSIQAVEAITILDDAATAQPLTLAGQLSAIDPDQGASHTYLLAAGTPAQSAYGTLALAADGSYTFELDPGALDALDEGQFVDVIYQAIAIDEHGAASAPRDIRFYLVGATETAGTAVDDALPASITGLDAHHLQATVDVLGNDPAGAQVYSLFQNLQGLPEGEPIPVVTSATLAGGATITLNEDGTLSYDGQTHYYNLESLPEGQGWTESFVYTALMPNGELSTARVTLEIPGVNDLPRVQGAEAIVIADDAAPAEPRVVTGQLVATDPDVGAVLSFSLAEGEDGISAYGSFSVASDGSYAFTLDPAALDAMAQGEFASFAFYVQAIDEHGARSAAQPIWLLLTGADEAPPVETVGVPPADGF